MYAGSGAILLTVESVEAKYAMINVKVYMWQYITILLDSYLNVWHLLICVIMCIILILIL